MSNELSILTGKGLSELKAALPNIYMSKAIAVKWLNLKALITGKAGEEFTKQANAHLMDCKDCEEVHEDGFGVKLITTTKKVYKETPDVKRAQKVVDKMEADLKIAKIDLQAAKDKAGYTEEQGLAYYKAIS